MDTKILIYLGVAFGLYIVFRILNRLLNRPNREFWRYYKEILTSSKYKVKGQFED